VAPWERRGHANWPVALTRGAVVQILEVYYVLHGMIYQAPTIISVLNARLRRCAYMLNKAMTSIQAGMDFELGQADMYSMRRPEQQQASEAAEPGEPPAKQVAAAHPHARMTAEGSAAVDRALLVSGGLGKGFGGGWTDKGC
jgi:hypothetical protein